MRAAATEWVSESPREYITESAPSEGIQWKHRANPSGYRIPGDDNKNHLPHREGHPMDQHPSKALSWDMIIDSNNPELYEVITHVPGRKGKLPLTADILLNQPSGKVFGMIENAGMGWDVGQLAQPEYLILSTLGGMRDYDGTPQALGYHTGHYELGLLVQEAAKTLKELGFLPYAGYCTDPCDGRTQGTTGMMDSLPYRNDASMVLRRLIRSLPEREGVIGVATCDKGLPAMMMALAASRDLPGVIVPGGATLPPTNGEDLGKIQSVGARFAHNEITLEEAAELGCRACASAGGGCHFLGTAGTNQIVAEGLGMALPHSALAPSGEGIWLDLARRSAMAVVFLRQKGLSMKDILTDSAVRNAMVVHAAFGGSTNLLLHIPAIAHAAGLRRPTVQDWIEVNRAVPRIVDVLPNGPHPTVRAFMAGGVPEVMLHLRQLGLLDEDCLTVTGTKLRDVLDWWEDSERRHILRKRLVETDGISPDDVIMSPKQAKAKGLTSTVTFPVGNLAPDGSVVKSTAIDPSVVDEDGVYRMTGPAKVFTTEREAIAALKKQGKKTIEPGDVIVLMGRGPSGSGMEETLQLTGALRHVSFGKHVALLTDARFSGVSTGACIGHIGPEALAGGPIGKVRDGDIIEIIIDRNNLTGSINLVGTGNQRFTPEEGARILAERSPHPDLAPDENLPDDTRLWAGLAEISGGTWGGCVYDTEAILKVIEAGKRALGK